MSRPRCAAGLLAIAMVLEATAVPSNVEAAGCTPTKFLVALNQSNQIDGSSRSFFKASAANDRDTICTNWSGNVTFSTSDPLWGNDSWTTNPAPASNGVASTSLVLVTPGTTTVTATSGALTGSASFPVGDTTITLDFPGVVQAGVATNMTVTARSAWTGLPARYFYSSLAVHTGDTAAEWYETFPDLDPTLPRWDGTDASGNLVTEIWHQTPSRGTVTFKTIFYGPGTKSIWGYDYRRTSNASSSQSLTVLPTTLAVFPPATALASQDSSVRVEARDASNQPLAGFEAQVRLTTSDAAASITAPNPYRFVAGDAGAHDYTARFNTLGAQTITATSVRYAAMSGTASTQVTAASFTLSFAAWYAGGSAIQAGEPAELTVTAGTPGNPLISYRGTIALTSSDSGAVFEGVDQQGRYTFTAADAGTHVFRVRFASAGTQSATATDVDNPGAVGSQSTAVAETYLVIESYPTSQPAKTEQAFVVCASKITTSCSTSNILYDFEDAVGISSTDPNIVRGPGLAADATYTYTGRGSQYATGIDDPTADRSKHWFFPSHLATGTYTITFSDVRKASRSVSATVTITTAPTAASGYELTVVPGQIDLSASATTQVRAMAGAASTTCTLNARVSIDAVSYCPKNVLFSATTTDGTSGNPTLRSSGEFIIASNVAGTMSITTVQPSGQKTAIATSIWVDGAQVGTLALGSTTNTATKTQTLPGIPTTGIHSVKVLATGTIANPLQLTSLVYVPSAAYGYTGYTGTVRLTSTPPGATFAGAPGGTYQFTGAGATADNGRHTFATTFSGPGSYQLNAVDTATSTIKSQPATISVSVAPPSGTVSVNSGAQYAASGSVTLTLTATGAGVDQMRFSNDGSVWSAWEAVASTKSWTLSNGDGSKSVFYQLKNTWGQIGVASSDTIVLDSSPPTVPTVIATGDLVAQIEANGTAYFQPSNGSMTLSAASSAGPSGLAAIRFENLTGGSGLSPAPDLPNEVTSAPFEQVIEFAPGATVGTIDVVAINGAGLASAPRTLQLVPDAQPPTASFSSPTEGPLSAASLPVAWSDSDAGSGVALRSLQRQRAAPQGGFCASLAWANDGPPREQPSPLSEPLADGYCYRWVLTLQDAVGNISTTQSATVLVDTNAPTVDFQGPTPGQTQWLGVSAVDVTWDDTDAGSGVVTRAVQQQHVAAEAGACPTSGWIDDAGSQMATSPFDATALTLGNCYRWVVTVEDAAGNATSSTSGSVLLDRMVLQSPTPGATLFATETFAVDVSPGIDVGHVDFSIDGNLIATDSAAPFDASWDTTAVSDGSHQLTAQVVETGGPTTSLTADVTVANALAATQRLDIDFAGGKATVDDYVLNGIYALGAPFMVGDRYQSPTPSEGDTSSLAPLLSHWSEISEPTRDEIEAFLDQPLRGALYGAVEDQGSMPMLAGDQPDGIADPCTHVTNPGYRGYGGGSGYKCVHESDHFAITYVLEGVGSFTAESTSATPDELNEDPISGSCPDPVGPNNCNGVPDWIDKIARGLEDAYDIYTLDLSYPVNWSGRVPVQIDNTNGGQVLPTLFSVQTIQIGHDRDTPYYLAHHELFHVFQYEYTNPLTQGVQLLTADPWWWMEATAVWASGIVSRSGVPGDEGTYVNNLPDFLGRPGEELSSFDRPPGGRAYGAFVLAEYLAENVDHDGAGNPRTNLSIIKETWEQVQAGTLQQPVVDAIERVAEAHGTSLPELLPDFAYANYLLAYDDALVGGPPSDVEAAWRTRLDSDERTAADNVGPPRPKRDSHDIVSGQELGNELFLPAGGVQYVDVAPPATQSIGEMVFAVAAPTNELQARVVTLRYPAPPTQPTICLETPIFIEGGTGFVSVPLTAECRYAVLILTANSVPGSRRVGIGWSAKFVAGSGVFDSFERTTPSDGSQSLGHSEYGDHQWLTNGGHPYTDGSQAAFETSASTSVEASRAYQWWEPTESPQPPWSSDHFTVETRFNLSAMAGSADNADRLGVDLLFDDFANWRGVWVDLVDAPQDPFFRPRVLGVAANWTSGGYATIPIDELLPNTEYILKWEVEIGVVMRAKLWKVGDVEPDWQVSIPDPGDATFAGVNSEVLLYSVMYHGFDQTKRFAYLDVHDGG